MGLKRIESTILNLNENIEVFMCPFCKGAFKKVLGNSLTCVNGHNFDVSKKGYLNLCNLNNNKFYSLELFKAKDEISKKVFGKLFESVCKKLLKLNDNSQIRIIDAGCGSGFLLLYIQNWFLELENKRQVKLVGFDISKDAILLAAKKSQNINWFVADIANIPLKNKSVDFVLNIFTPSNYAQFNRVLKDDGFLLKVIPNSGYLKEVRAYLGIQKEYTNEGTIDLISKNFDLVESTDICYTVDCIDEAEFYNIIKMTPLSFNFDFSKIKDIRRQEKFKITIDVKLLIAKKK